MSYIGLGKVAAKQANKQASKQASKQIYSLTCILHIMLSLFSYILHTGNLEIFIS